MALCTRGDTWTCHCITYGSYMAYPKETYIVFDAHYDLRDGYIGSKFSHASYLRRIIEERGAKNILHVGARAYAKEELGFASEHQMSTITDEDIRSGSGPQMVSEFVLKHKSTYASFDLDVLDPAFAPGVGSPEAAGISARELFDMLSSLSASHIVGADIVELNPMYDNGATAVIAAKILSSIIAAGVANRK